MTVVKFRLATQYLNLIKLTKSAFWRIIEPATKIETREKPMPNKKLEVSLVKFLLIFFCCLGAGLFFGLKLGRYWLPNNPSCYSVESAGSALDQEFSRLAPAEKKIALDFVQLIRAQFSLEAPLLERPERDWSEPSRGLSRWSLARVKKS